MATWKVKGFILGCNPKLTEEVEYVEADTEKKAEEDFLWHREGYGIISTTKMSNLNTAFSESQVDAIKDEVSIMLGNIIFDHNDRHEVVDAVLDDVLSDIEETADWSKFEEDEYSISDSDITIALARVVSKRMKVDK